MKWMAVPSLLLLTGCAILRPEPAQIMRNDWAILEKHLETAPISLRQELERVALPRLAEENFATAQQSRTPKTAEQTLGLLLENRPKGLLRPDQSFKAHCYVVEGETQDLADAFSSALSAYLLNDKSFTQQPIYTRYFQQRYASLPTSEVSDAVPFYVVDKHEGGSLLWLDPHRVRSIHLIFAGQGESMASRFGHVALRLVISPEDAPSDEHAADRNLYEHMVLGYMAHIDELELSSIKALKGDYKTFLFASPFMDVYSKYTIGEYREMYSLPLELSERQREQMVRELSEIHWRFSSDYNFITANCSTRLQEALRVLIGEYPLQKSLKKTYKRPDTFFEAIQETPLVMSGKIESLKQAEREGYYFPSTKPYYEKALGVVIEAMQQPSFSTLEEYLERSALSRLAAIVNDPVYFEHISLHPYDLEAQILLEELALIRGEQGLMKETLRYFQQIDIEKDAEEIREQLSAEDWKHYEVLFLRPFRRLTQPLPRQHGIPERSEAQVAEPLLPADYIPLERKDLTELLSRIHPKEKTQWDRVVYASGNVEETIETICILKEMLDEKN